MSMHDHAGADEADLARFGYKQELRRSLGVFSSFAVAFSYISPSTGIFTLFALGLGTIGGVFIWSWPLVAFGQFMIALGFAELASHYPVAGSVFQWTKYLAGKTYSWFAGWIYLFAGILTVTAVCVTLPLALIPAFNNMGWDLANNLHNQRIFAIVTLVVITIMNIFGVKLVAIVNNTGVLFEILGMVVFAFVLALFHHHQSGAVIFHTGGTTLTTGTFLIAMFMSLFVIYGFDTAGTLAEETKNPRREAPKAILGSIIGAFIIGGIFLYALPARHPEPRRRDQGAVRPGRHHRRELRQRVLDGLPARRRGGDLRLLPLDPDVDHPPRLRHGARRQLPARRCSPRCTPGCTRRSLRASRSASSRSSRCCSTRAPAHRDRRDGDDLPLVLPREHRAHARTAARLAEGEGAVLARPLGHPRSTCWRSLGAAAC